MTKSTKLALLILSHALLGGGGIVLGYLAHERAVSNFAFMDEATIVSRAATHMELQRAQGSSTDYKEALTAYLQVLQKYAQEPSGLFTEKVLSIDKTLTYVRLARIAEKEGKISETNTYSKSAIVSCGGTGWKDCSKERLWSLTAQLDERGGLRASSEPQGK